MSTISNSIHCSPQLYCVPWITAIMAIYMPIRLIFNASILRGITRVCSWARPELLRSEWVSDALSSRWRTFDYNIPSNMCARIPALDRNVPKVLWTKRANFVHSLLLFGNENHSSGGPLQINCGMTEHNAQLLMHAHKAKRLGRFRSGTQRRWLW